MDYYLFYILLGDDTNSKLINESSISNTIPNTNLDLYNTRFDETVSIFDSTIKEISTSSSSSNSFDSYSSNSNSSYDNLNHSNETHSSSSFDSYGGDSSGSGSGSGGD